MLYTEAPTLLLLCGLPFSGKSTLARSLAAQRGYRQIALDAINSERGLGIDAAPITPQQWDASYAEAYRRVAAALCAGQSVVYDETNFLRAQRDALGAIAARCGALCRVIIVTTPADVARQRWLTNRANPQRGDVRDADFALVLARFEPPTDDENPLVYDGVEPAADWIARTFTPRTGSHTEA